MGLEAGSLKSGHGQGRALSEGSPNPSVRRVLVFPAGGCIVFASSPSECVCVSSSLCVCVCVCVCELLSRVQLSPTLWAVAHQAALGVGLSRQASWSRWPCPSHFLLLRDTVHTGLGPSPTNTLQPDDTCGVQMKFPSQDLGLRAAIFRACHSPPADGEETFETASFIGQNTRIKDQEGRNNLKPKKRAT